MDYLLNPASRYLTALNAYARVLNLIINGLPSKLDKKKNAKLYLFAVLNLIINGLPSKRASGSIPSAFILSFKPYYKWITF